MKKTPPPKVCKFPSAKQRRLDKLLDKNSEGTITDRERIALEQLVAEAERLMITNAKRLARLSKQGTAAHRGTPVTIWVQPHQAER